MSGFIQRSFIVTAVSLCVLAGCQSNPKQRVVADPKGVDQVAYEKELAECSTLADTAGKTGAAAKAALAAAVTGGALGGIFGDGRGAATMGAGGAVIARLIRHRQGGQQQGPYPEKLHEGPGL